MKRLCIGIILFLGSYIFVVAQTDKTIRKHAIVALDRHPGLSEDDPIRYALSDAGIMVPKLLHILSPILSDSDYVSVVNYSLRASDMSFDAYTTNTICWSTFGDFQNTIRSKWGTIALNHPSHDDSFSMISGAKFFSFHSLYGKNNGKYSNKTYLLDINDEFFNGNDDYKNEFIKDYKGLGGILSFDSFKKTIISVGQEYYFEHKDEFVVYENQNNKKIFKAILYEITPKPVALNTIIDYPAYLGIHRVRSGYRIIFDYSNVTPDYNLRRLEICSMQGREVFDTTVLTENKGSVLIDLDRSKIKGDTLKVLMRGWLEPIDTIYTGLILSPYDDNMKNLTVHLSIPLDNDPKIFGIIPLYDLMWWWYPNDIQSAIVIWDIILIMLLVVVICVFAYLIFNRLTKYVPRNNVIKINRTQ